MFKKKVILVILILIFIGIVSINSVSSASNTNENEVTSKSNQLNIYNSVYSNTGDSIDEKSPGLYIYDEGDNKKVQTIAYKKVKAIKVTTISGKTKLLKDEVNFKNTRCKNGYYLNITIIPHTWPADYGNSSRILILYGDFIRNVDVIFYNPSELDPNEPINNTTTIPNKNINLKDENIPITDIIPPIIVKPPIIIWPDLNTTNRTIYPINNTFYPVNNDIENKTPYSINDNLEYNPINNENIGNYNIKENSAPNTNSKNNKTIYNEKNNIYKEKIVKAAMKPTGMPIIAIILVLLSSLGIITRKKQ